MYSTIVLLIVNDDWLSKSYKNRVFLKSGNMFNSENDQSFPVSSYSTSSSNRPELKVGRYSTVNWMKIILMELLIWV